MSRSKIQKNRIGIIFLRMELLGIKKKLKHKLFRNFGYYGERDAA